MGDIFGIPIPLPQSILDPIIAKLLGFFDPIIKPIKGAINIFTNFGELTVGTWTLGIELADNIVGAYGLLKEFSVNFNKDARHRVVETVRAYQQIRRLAIDIPVELWKAIGKIWAAGFSPITESFKFGRGVAVDIESLGEGAGDLKTFLTKLGPKIGKIVGRVFEILQIIVGVLQKIHDELESLNTIAADLREEIEKVNRLNFIFLPQNNQRERVKLADGSTYYRRLKNTPIER